MRRRAYFWRVAVLAAAVVAAGGAWPAAGLAAAGPTVLGTIGGLQGPIAVAVDPSANRLYVLTFWGPARDRTEAGLAILDASSQASLATVPGLGWNPGGLAVDPAAHRAYVLDGFSGELSTIDTTRNQRLHGAPSGINQAGALALNAASGRLYAIGALPDVVGVLDAGTAKLLARVSRPDILGGIDVNPNTNRVYVATSTGGHLAVIDGAANTLVADVPLHAVGTAGPAIDLTTNRVFVGAWDRVAVVDGASNAVVSSSDPLGQRLKALAFDGGLQHLYATFGSNQLAILDTTGDGPPTLITSVSLPGAGGSLAVNPSSHQVYVVLDGNANAVAVVQDVEARPPPRTAAAPAPSGDPIQGTLSIDAGRLTDSQTVELHLAAQTADGAAVTQMHVWDDASDSSWIDYADTLSWDLSETEGQKIIHASFQDEQGRVSATIDANITFCPAGLPTAPAEGTVLDPLGCPQASDAAP